MQGARTRGSVNYSLCGIPFSFIFPSILILCYYLGDLPEFSHNYRAMVNTQILIVGAGPTGLTLACELARRNVSFRIIDRVSEYQTGSRAKGVQPRSLEVFDDLGVAQELAEASFTELVYRRFNGNQLLGDVKRETFPREDTQYIQGFVVPQWKVEVVLREKLAEYGVKVELATELVEFSQNDESVTAVLKNSSETEEVNCEYLVACDGGKSNIRKALGIKFEGETHEEEKLLVGDVEVKGLTPDAWHVWVHPEFGFSIALCPFRCTKSWQLQAIAFPDENGDIPEPDLEIFNRIFQERARMPEVKLKNMTWHSIYRVNVRMADKYRVGRVFIAGDAAHVHSTAGGLGMNTGIQDAYNLGWKLAAVVKDNAPPSLLDTYEEERLPIAGWTLNISSQRQSMLAESAKHGGSGLENIATKDTTQLNLNYRYSSLSVDLSGEYDSLQAGDRAPDAKLSDGSWLFDLYRGTHFTVLAFDDTEESVKNIDKTFGEGVKAYRLTDPNARSVFGNRSKIFVIRPDGYIGLVTKSGETEKVIEYLRRFR